MSASVCQGCGVELPPPTKYGRQRKWCGETCRKAQYAGACVECGGPTTGCNGHGPNAPERCAKCNTAHVVRLQIERGAQHRALVERMWAEGKSCREIGHALGWTCKPGPMISRMRGRGYNLPHRYSPERVARITAGSAERLARAREIARQNRERTAA